ARSTVMRVATTTVALSIACGLTFVSLSAQEQPTQPGRGTPPVQTPTQPGQGSKPSQPGTPGSPSQMATANREVSFTGCLTRGSSSAAAAGQQNAETFVLMRARPASGAGAAAAAGSQ